MKAEARGRQEGTREAKRRPAATPGDAEGPAESALDSFSAHVAILDEAGTIVATNRAWRRFAHANSPVTANVCEGANYLAVCEAAAGPGAEESGAMAAGIRAVGRGEKQELVLEYPCHSPQAKRWFSARVTRFLDQGAVRIVVAHEDVTTRKRTEQIQDELIKELATNAVRLNVLVQTIPDMVWLKSVDGVFFWCNPVFERLCGAKEADIIGRTDYDFLDKELADFVREHDRIAMEVGGPSVNEEWLTFADDGHRALCETIKTPMYDTEGHLLGVLGIARDITARYEAEEAQRKLAKELATKEAFLRTLLNTVPDPIWLKDVNGVYIFCNAGLEKFLSIREADIRGKSDYELVDREMADTYTAIDRRVMAEGGRNVDETWLTFAADGRRALCETIKTPMRDADGQIIGVLGIARDITERHLAEQKLRQTLGELARSNEELEQFAYVASHDLQEPLRMVSSYTQLLGHRYQGRLDADADEFIAYAVDGANRMQGLINDLLAYSRVGTRGKPFETVDLETVLAQALGNLRSRIEESGAEITHAPLPALIADRTQMTQLFQNLIGNAVKFHAGGRPHVHISAEPGDDEWEFTVRDDGVGIDPQYLDRIFAIFQRLHTRQEYPGTGIGLAICKKVAERHGGRIWVESQPGRGSAFHFTVAQKEIEEP